MGKLVTHNSKILKLQNVLLYKVPLVEEDLNIAVVVQQMQSYIKTKGAVQIGPLIEYTNTYVNELGELEVEIIVMLQCNNYIHNVENPYTMEAVRRITNCMYCRYIGPETSLSFAYDKINIEAFENEIQLKGDSYTIFVAKDEETEKITADVFMERAD